MSLTLRILLESLIAAGVMLGVVFMTRDKEQSVQMRARVITLILLSCLAVMMHRS